MKYTAWSALATFTFCTNTIMASPFAGTFLNEAERAEIRLQVTADGRVAGFLVSDVEQTPISGQVSGEQFTGSIDMPDFKQPIIGHLKGEVLEITLVGAPELARPAQFRRVNTGGSVAGPMPPRADAGAAPDRPPPLPAQNRPTRHVIVNDQPLSDAELAALEQGYRVRIADANYWYDAVCGAWGFKGGPTVGFIPPGLGLGGPLKAHASGRGTGVFINGREAHVQDVVALQVLIQKMIPPGRYFITADGTCGYEGGPVTGNLLAAARQARTQQGGSGPHRSGLTDIGVGGDGSGSYVIGPGFSASSF